MSSTPDFPLTFRGYDPVRVTAHLRAVTESAAQQSSAAEAELSAQRSELERLNALVVEHEAMIAGHEATLRAGFAPSFAQLGERVTTILSLAEEEAAELQAATASRVAHLLDDAERRAREVRATADAYSTRTRADAEAVAMDLVAVARTRAAATLADGEREALVRRQEAEAFFETTRSHAAAAATDFEAALAARREHSDTSLEDQVAQQNRRFQAEEERFTQLVHDRESEDTSLRAERTRLLEEARAQALQLVSAAEARAERVRGDSERELAAATVRRDAITAQLGNLRTMLAAVGGEEAAPAMFTGSTPTSEPDGTDPFNVSDASPERTQQILDSLAPETVPVAPAAQPDSEAIEPTEPTQDAAAAIEPATEPPSEAIEPTEPTEDAAAATAEADPSEADHPEGNLADRSANEPSADKVLVVKASSRR
ncbi:MAG: hypothetical protein ABI131_08850 [Nostocoides sp.]